MCGQDEKECLNCQLEQCIYDAGDPVPVVPDRTQQEQKALDRAMDYYHAHREEIIAKQRERRQKKKAERMKA